MGDSITEGTIVEWTVDVGQAVQEGDVVALIETDKVTIDIKAKSSGVVTQQFGKVDDTVAVGAKLYEIDSDGVSSSRSVAPTKGKASPAPSKPDAKDTTTSDKPDTTITSSSHRTPSIQFLGKNGWHAIKTVPSNQQQQKVVVQAKPSNNPLAINVIYDDSIDSTYGRPKFSDAEIEALMMGGASTAPSVVSMSSGATFSP